MLPMEVILKKLLRPHSLASYMTINLAKLPYVAYVMEVGFDVAVTQRQRHLSVWKYGMVAQRGHFHSVIEWNHF